MIRYSLHRRTPEGWMSDVEDAPLTNVSILRQVMEWLRDADHASVEQIVPGSFAVTFYGATTNWQYTFKETDR